MMETKPPVPCVTVSAARRCNSTEVIDDGSSHTSQSSVEYSAPGNHTHRRRTRGRHRNDLYANTGSMPNLAQPDTRCYAYQPQGRPNTTAYYITGYPNHLEPEPYANRVYMYEDELEGHYNVNPSYHHYHHAQQGYYGHDVQPQYGSDVTDSLPHNVYATIRPPRNRPPTRSTEQVSRSIQKALVVEHLKGWYQRNAPQKQETHHYDRGSQHSLSYQTMPAPYPHNHRNMYYSSGWCAALHARELWPLNKKENSDFDLKIFLRILTFILSGKKSELLLLFFQLPLSSTTAPHCLSASRFACSPVNLYHFSPVSSASSSSGNWHMSNRGMSDYDMPMHESFSCSYSTAPYGHPTHSR